MIYYEKCLRERMINMSEKTQGEELKERLFNCKKSGWEKTSEDEGSKIFQYCNGYINFLNNYLFLGPF